MLTVKFWKVPTGHYNIPNNIKKFVSGYTTEHHKVWTGENKALQSSAWCLGRFSVPGLVLTAPLQPLANSLIGVLKKDP